jgi:hypothetical protein
LRARSKTRVKTVPADTAIPTPTAFAATHVTNTIVISYGGANIAAPTPPPGAFSINTTRAGFTPTVNQPQPLAITGVVQLSSTSLQLALSANVSTGNPIFAGLFARLRGQHTAARREHAADPAADVDRRRVDCLLIQSPQRQRGARRRE